MRSSTCYYVLQQPGKMPYHVTSSAVDVVVKQCILPSNFDRRCPDCGGICPSDGLQIFSFPWEEKIRDLGSEYLLRNVVNSDEFRAQLNLLLGKKTGRFCTTMRVVRWTDITRQKDIAILSASFSREAGYEKWLEGTGPYPHTCKNLTSSVSA